MAIPLIRYDATHMRSSAVGRYGASAEQLKSRTRQLKRAKQAVLTDWNRGKQGWLSCPDNTEVLAEIAVVVAACKRFTTCVVIGIGGSDLGTRAAYHALKHTGKGMTLEFAGGNTDPDELAELLSRLDLAKTCVNIISKSGDTIEPMSAFFIIRDLLKKKFGARASEHIIATTDPTNGSLRALAEREGYATLSVPPNVGGRFSVLTAVGLFPLACAGIDIRKLLKGAKDVRTQWLRSATDAASAYALHQYVADTDRKQSIHVLMPYSSRLELFGRWYRQIWAESLGKKMNRAGDMVHVGPTPVAALGATDQHSQVQLYVEGPYDKTVTFVTVGTFDSALAVPRSAHDVTPLGYLAGIPLAKIIHAEHKGTVGALTLAHRPNGTITINRVSPESLGALFMFFQLATGVAGELYGVNPYDQPGVEEGKRKTARRLHASI